MVVPLKTGVLILLPVLTLVGVLICALAGASARVLIIAYFLVAPAAVLVLAVAYALRHVETERSQQKASDASS